MQSRECGARAAKRCNFPASFARRKARGLQWTVLRKCAPNAPASTERRTTRAECITSERRRKKGPWRVHASGHAGKSLSCDPRANACRMSRAPRSVAQTRIKRSALRRRPHATDTALTSNSVAPSPQKEPHCQQITSPRTKGLPWWNLLANLTVMLLRQPTSKRILPNIQGSWFGFSWACPS